MSVYWRFSFVDIMTFSISMGLQLGLDENFKIGIYRGFFFNLNRIWIRLIIFTENFLFDLKIQICYYCNPQLFMVTQQECKFWYKINVRIFLKYSTILMNYSFIFAMNKIVLYLSIYLSITRSNNCYIYLKGVNFFFTFFFILNKILNGDLQVVPFPCYISAIG